jgi:hypothetical protein
MKKIKFIYWLAENLFNDKAGNAMCCTVIILALLFVVLQAARKLVFIAL